MKNPTNHNFTSITTTTTTTMGSPPQVPATQTAPYWTEEKHVHFLNTIEASFVRTMLQNNHHLHLLRLDRHLPDTSESTLDLKPHHHSNRRRTTKHHAPSGPAARRTRRRSSQPFNSSEDQVVPQVENEREIAVAGDCHEDKVAEN